MTTFKAFRISKVDKQIVAGFQQITLNDLTAGEVVIAVSYSSINYKDALAGTGKGQILRQYPLNGGIDLAGTVVNSIDSRFSKGQRVLVCGCGLSETADGGYAQYARVCGDCVVAIPDTLTDREAMGIGSAGFTAALTVMRMEQLGQKPELGPILVTGASGGVGSFAIDLFSNRGYEVVAFTGKVNEEKYLKSLGAHTILDRHSLEMGTRPLEKATWGGAVDSIGGAPLAWLTRTVVPYGNIASIGLAAGHTLETTVMPFILRGVSLIGINSIEMSHEMRNEAWQRLSGDLKPQHLNEIISNEIKFDLLPQTFDAYINGMVKGRTIVEIN